MIPLPFSARALKAGRQNDLNNPNEFYAREDAVVHGEVHISPDNHMASDMDILNVVSNEDGASHQIMGGGGGGGATIIFRVG